MRKTRFAYFLHFRGSHQVLTQAWTLTLARENKKAPSPTKGTKHIPRYHPDSCIYRLSRRLTRSFTSLPTEISETRLRCETQKLSELKEAYSRWLPLSERK